MGTEQQTAPGGTAAPAAGDDCPVESVPAAILDSLTTHIALLDSTGTILLANAAWKRFARDNQAREGTCYLGDNYFAVCEHAVSRDGDPAAAAALSGIRAVLNRERQSFTVDYPCHSPTQRRWFRLRATRLSVEGRAECVVAHEDITPEKTAEEELRETERKLRESLERERLLARTDELTGLTNRRRFLELAEHELAVARRYGSPVAVMLFDIDDFKKINDSLGHPAGDEILKAVALRAGQQLRSADVLARYGGDEFMVLAPESTAQSAAVIAERIRRAIAETGVPTDAGAATVTISTGVSETRRDSDTLEDLIRRADEALYAAKVRGRNRTAVRHSGDRGSGRAIARTEGTDGRLAGK